MDLGNPHKFNAHECNCQGRAEANATFVQTKLMLSLLLNDNQKYFYTHI